MDLLKASELPQGFFYAPQFVRLIDPGLTDLEPCSIVDGDQLRWRFDGLRLRFPTRSLVPFAEMATSDDVACWDLDRGGRVALIDDFEAPGFERLRVLDDVYAWLRLAVEDLIERDL
ncbi:hypothetical protein [Aeromicrobium sp.]|uniref:hypothetical protein n=1 Tax=Aeromicrobium sp. TaxID=1871063 RepID=UPI003511F8B1